MRWAPIRFHDAAAFPYPLLRAHLEDTIARDRAAAQKMMTRCLYSFAQQPIGLAALRALRRSAPMNRTA